MRAQISAAHGPGEHLAAQFTFDAIFPFIVLIGVSLLTRVPEARVLDQFYGKMKTPVGASPELEEAAMAATRENPNRFNSDKMVPGSRWEFGRWDRTDFVGFFLCCTAISVSIVVLFRVALSTAK